ncbi:hypothetical protein I4U23_016107 [Adineta vaga]|nr:hypothetical protein I4U23_016107 [Adineta vaga]
MTNLEQLPNELLLLCFVYLDFYSIYEIFFHLNLRFNQLIRYRTKIHLHLPSIPSGKFFQFCYQLKQYIETTENYPCILVAESKYKLKLILEDEFFTESFSKLRSLILSNVDCQTVGFIIFDCPTKLYENLERLSLLNNVTEYDRKSRYNIEWLCNNLISSKMKSLKYLKLNIKHYKSESHFNLNFDEFTMENKSISNLETLIIGYSGYHTYTIVSFETLTEKLLLRLSNLKNLLIDFLEFENYCMAYGRTLPSTTDIISNVPSSLQYVKIEVEGDGSDPDDEKIVTTFLRNFFLNSNPSDKRIVKIIFIDNSDSF